MEDPYEDDNSNPEVIEDLYILKTKIDTSDIAKLRRELQQVRVELAQAQAEVRKLRTSSEGSFSQLGNINVTSQLKMELDKVNALKHQQRQIMDQINSGSIRDTEVFTRALGSLNSEIESIGKNSNALEAAITIMEGAMGRMAAVSKKSQDYKQLQESFNSLGIEANITGRGGRLDLSKVTAEAERINNTPVTIKFNDQELTTTVGQLEFVEAILKRIAAQTKQNIVLTKALAGQVTSSVITPSAGGAKLSSHAYIPPAFFVERAQSVNRDNTGFTQPARVAMAAFHGVPLMSLATNQQVASSTSSVTPRGTSADDIREVLKQAELLKESPARNQFMTMGTSTFLDVSSMDKLTGVMSRFITKIDSVVLADMRYIGDRYGGRRQFTQRSQMSGIIDGIISDEDIGSMERAFHFQVAKMMALYNVDWQDAGGSQHWRRGRSSANITDKDLAVLDLIDQFPGSLRSSEISHSLEMGHYQTLNAHVRDLQKKGMVRRAIVPPLPIPEAGIDNQIHPAIMAMLASDPSLFMQFAMEASPIKFLDTSERGRQVLEMMGTYSNPARVNTGMQLNSLVTNPEDTLVENYKSQMALPPANAWWLRGYNMLNYGDSPSGSKLLFHLEEMLNNQEAYNPEFMKFILPFIPHTVDERTGRYSVNPEGWVGKDSGYQLHPTNAGQYLGARSDINWALRTPYMFIDKLMESVAHPNRELFAKNMLGNEAYLKSILNWASGPQGRGINPQLERYTITPEQATQHFKILFGSLKLDTSLTKAGDKFEQQYGRQYTPYNQYEKSIIIRAANEMLKRALPVSSGMEVGVLEALRNRSFMSKGEGLQVDKMLYGARQDELTQLIRSVPDLHRYFRAFEAYQRSVLETYNNNTTDMVGVLEESAESIGPAKPVSPEMRRRITNEQNAAASWKRYPEFWGTGYGQTYEDIYTKNESGVVSSDPNISRSALSKLNMQSEKAIMRTAMPSSYMNKFKRETNRSPLKGFTGVLPWNNVLEYYSQYGSQELNEEGQREFERLMNNPADLMKEIMWDYTYVKDEHTKNPKIKNVIMDTYGTVMKKRPMFGWVSELKNPEAVTALQEINDKYSNMFEPAQVQSAIDEYIAKFDLKDVTDAGRYSIEDTVVKQIQQQAHDEILNWTDKFGIDSVRTGDITNVFKMKPDNTVSKFYDYVAEEVPTEDVIKRMQYDMQKGRMDPRLLEKYARAVASQKTRKDTGYSFKEGIESMWRNAGWDYEEMEGLPQLIENQALFGFVRTGTEGSFDFAGKGHKAGVGWDNQAIMDATGIDTSLIDDDMLHDMINTNMEFRGEVKSTLMDALGFGSEKEWQQYIQYASHQTRQRLKRWQQITMSLKPGVDEFNENFTNTYTDDRENFREPYDFGEVQTDFGNITDVALLDYLKQEYYGRQYNKPKKGALSAGIENAQYKILHDTVYGNKIDYERAEKERVRALRAMREMPSVESTESFGEVRQSFGAYTPDQDWFPMWADTSSITNSGFRMETSPAMKLYEDTRKRFGISPLYQPSVIFTDKIPGNKPGSYRPGKNVIEISPDAKDPAAVMAHEYMHPIANERLLHRDNLQKMVEYYQGNQIPMFEHSKTVGEQLRNTQPAQMFDKNYLKQLRRKDPEAYAMELARIAPFRKVFEEMGSEGVKNLFAMGEEVAIVMEKYHGNYETHVKNLFGSTASNAQKAKVAYVRNLVGIDTDFEGIGGLLPGAQEYPLLTDGSDRMFYNYGWEMKQLRDPKNKVRMYLNPQQQGAMSIADKMALRYTQWQTKRYEDMKRSTATLPDVSMVDMGKTVTERGTEIPFIYQVSGTKVNNGVAGIYEEYDRYKKWLESQEYDTSTIKTDIQYQKGMEGERNPQGTMSGKLRVPDSILKGRSIPDVIQAASNEAKLGYSDFNDQAARYEKTMDKMPKWTDEFARHGKAIAGVSWQFTTLQMAALGIFFSMMSLVSVMGQGIGMIVGGVGDLESMMKAKAMAGMSGQFYDEKTGEVFSGTYIDEQLGITDQTRLDAWKNLTDFSSTLTTMLSGFGSEVLTHPGFLKASNTFLNKLFDVLKDDKNLEAVVGLSETLLETLGSIVDKLPGLIQLFDTIAKIHVPEGIPGIGGQSALSVYGNAALLSLIAMPILAGVTLFTKLTGWMMEGVGLLGGISRWNTGRKLEQFLLKEGYSKEVAAAARAGYGVPKVTPEDAAFYKRAGIDASKLPTTGLGDDVLKSGSKLASVIDDIAERLAPIAAKLPKRATVATAAVVAGASVVTKGVEATSTPNDDIAKAAANAATNVVGDTTGTSKWKWVGKKVGANAIGMIPLGVETLAPETAPLMGPTNMGSIPYGVARMAGVGSAGASIAAAPVAVVLNAAPVGGGFIQEMDGRMVERQKQMGFFGLDLPFFPASNKYTDVDTGEQLNITDYDWEMAKKQANGLADEPLNSKWTKQSSTQFSQTNYITMPTTDEKMDSIEAKLNAVMRMLGA